MRRIAVIAGLLAVVSAGAARLEAQERAYVVIVNESNFLTNVSTAELNRLFMKQTVRWTTGQAVTAVDLRADAPAREAFSQEVMGRSVAEIKAHWQTVIFSGRGIPPMEAPSEQAVVQFVRTTPGAIGYVSSGTPLAQGVRAVRVRS